MCSDERGFVKGRALAVALGIACCCAVFSSDAPGGQEMEADSGAKRGIGSELDMSDLKALQNRAGEWTARGTDTENAHRKEAEKQAEALFRHSRSDSFRARVKEEERRVREILSGMTGRDQGDAREGEEGEARKKDTAGDRRPLLKDNERIYVFISSSVPMRTLRNYARDIDRLGEKNISFVMRGFVGGMGLFGPTSEFLQALVVDDPACWTRDPGKCRGMNVEVLIDPMLFRAFGVESVPAIAYERSSRRAGADYGLRLEADPTDSYMVYGDASLTEALEAVNRVVRAKSLAGILRRLEG